MSRKLSLLDQFASLLVRRTYVCQSCFSKSSLSKPVANRRFLNSQSAFSPLHRSTPKRHASTQNTITAVHVPRSTPQAFRKLDQALATLEKEAAVYVDTSQLRLALRGLESGNAVTRIAVLGVESKQGAARLARALLADPLAPEPTWEKDLVDLGFTDGKAVLLKYGEQFKVDNAHPLIKTLYIPSSILHTHNLEMLVQSVNVSDGLTGTDSLLVPSLETQGSATGRMSMLTFPVHKVLIYADSLDAMPSIENTQYMGSMIQRVVDGSWSALQPSRGQAPSTIPVNLSLSEVAIETFRKSVERSVEFEHAWFDSGMPSVASWLSDGTQASLERPKPSVGRLIELITATTSQAIQNEEDTQLQESKTKEVPRATKDLLEQAISIWAENAHTELRDRLTSAFVSRTWSKTKWWKLFWRVDEVGFVASDILNKAWLVDAEKEKILISGRIQQSGLLGQPKAKQMPQLRTTENAAKTVLYKNPEAPTMADLLDDIKPFEPDKEEEEEEDHPWPDSISHARSALSRVTIPPLQALSQKLTLQTLSTTFLTSTLSALVYISISSTSLYEAGAIAALGLVFSLRRLQTKWETARSEWRRSVKEEGRQVLKREEQLLRETVRRGGEVPFDFAAVEQRRVASEALVRVKEALDGVGDGRVS